MTSRLLILKDNIVHFVGRGHRFERDKVLQVWLRPSYIYWKHPYVMKLHYKEPWVQTSMTMAGKIPVPIVVHHDSMMFKFKIGTIEKVKRLMEELEDIGIAVKNTC